MYRLSETEFMQYRMAERFLNDTRKRHAMELEQAYENIHPTRTAFDYDQKGCIKKALMSKITRFI